MTSTARDLLLLCVALVSASVVAVLGLRGDPWAVPVGGYICATVALVGGLGFAISPPDTRSQTRFKVCLGLAVALGSAVVMMAVTGGPMSSVYHPWDSMLSAFILALVAVGTHTSTRLLDLIGAGRVIAELSMLGLLLAAAVWTVVFTGTRLDRLDASSVALMLFIGGYLLGVTMLTTALGHDAGLALASLSAAGLVVAALVTSYDYAANGQTGWVGQAVSCLCWPAVVAGLFHARQRHESDPALAQARTEARSLIPLGAVLTTALLALLYTLVHGRVLDSTCLWLLLAFLIACGLREGLRAWHAALLLGRLAGQAHVDSLTGLANLRALDERMSSLSTRSAGQISVLTIDLDRFKDVNDLLGREVGDELLRVFSDELTQLADGGGAEVFRTGGDEFVVLSLSGPHAAMQLAADVRRATDRAAAAVGGVHRVPVQASVGVAHVVRESRLAAPDLRRTLTQSTQAMRQAKSAGTGVALFDQPLATSQARTRLVEQNLRDRLRAGLGVEVHFQPVMQLSAYSLAGVEALARWTDDTLGPVAPSEFIQIAEDGGLMEELGEHILHAALEAAVSTGLIASGRWVAVNVSALQLRVRGFAGSVAQVLGRTGVPPRQLVIEVTESVFVRPDDPAVTALTELAALGVRVSLDDFGTGYSSLAYLTRLPVRGLKIDRSITSSLDDPKTTAIVVSIVEMARRLDLDVVVEGVETLDHERRARSLGLELVQGLLYAPALSVVDLTELLSRQLRAEQASRERTG